MNSIEFLRKVGLISNENYDLIITSNDGKDYSLKDIMDIFSSIKVSEYVQSQFPIDNRNPNFINGFHMVEKLSDFKDYEQYEGKKAELPDGTRYEFIGKTWCQLK